LRKNLWEDIARRKPTAARIRACKYDHDRQPLAARARQTESQSTRSNPLAASTKCFPRRLGVQPREASTLTTFPPPPTKAFDVERYRPLRARPFFSSSAQGNSWSNPAVVVADAGPIAKNSHDLSARSASVPETIGSLLQWPAPAVRYDQAITVRAKKKKKKKSHGRLTANPFVRPRPPYKASARRWPPRRRGRSTAFSREPRIRCLRVMGQAPRRGVKAQSTANPLAPDGSLQSRLPRTWDWAVKLGEQQR